MFNKIIIVCTGNICRSPIAEGLLRARLHHKHRMIQSAGVGALVGEPADPLAVELARDAGVDISGHRAQQATMPLLQDQDLILTLDQTHNDYINRQYPQLRGRAHKLLRWSGNRDVVDPYRQPREVFEKAFEDIEQGVEDWLKRLK